MIKYILPEDSRIIIKFDTENTDNVKTINSTPTRIDCMWIIDEDGEFNGKPVKKGNVIIKFYNNYNKEHDGKIVIINDEQFTSFYTEYKEDMENYNNNLNDQSKCENSCCEKTMF